MNFFKNNLYVNGRPKLTARYIVKYIATKYATVSAMWWSMRVSGDGKKHGKTASSLSYRLLPQHFHHPLTHPETNFQPFVHPQTNHRRDPKRSSFERGEKIEINQQLKQKKGRKEKNLKEGRKGWEERYAFWALPF